MEQLKKQIVLVFLLCIFAISGAFAQDFKKADLLYRARSYADAIPIYEKGLLSKDSRSARSKLAFSYKMLNQMKKAEEQYALFINDKKTRPDDFFNYAEVLMSQAKYEEAKVWFLKYHEIEPDEEKGLKMADACDQIPFLNPLFPEAVIKEFPYNTNYDESSPVFYNNEMVFSSDRKTGVKLLKQKSGTTGRDFIRLYASSLNENGEWSEPKNFSGKLNEHNKNNANASFSTDGNEVFFTRNGNISNRKNAFTLQLHSARKEKGKWKGIEIVSVCRLGNNYMHPAISPDGNTLFFVSDKPGGKGGTDIFYCERKGDDWGRAINMDSMVNTSAHEGFPFMNADGKLYFCSKGHIGYGGFDIFVTEKLEDGSWAKPVNVGQPINSPLDDISIFINKENTKGAFTSSRKGGDDDIFLFALDGSFPAVSETELVVEEIEDAPSTVITEMPITEMDKPVTEELITAEVYSAEHIPDMETTPIDSEITPSVAKQVEDIPLEKKVALDSKPSMDVTPIETTIEVAPVETPAIAIDLEPEASVVNEQKIVPQNALEVKEMDLQIPTENGASAQNISDVEAVSEIEDSSTDVFLANEAVSAKAFQKAVAKGKQQTGMYYTLDGMDYFPGEYLLAPKMTVQLEPIAKLLTEHPNLKLEVAVHTESIGYDDNNLVISQKRAKAIKNYLLYKGIESTRISAIGLGETKILNRCTNGVVCTEEEHMENQRVEVKVR